MPKIKICTGTNITEDNTSCKFQRDWGIGFIVLRIRCGKNAEKPRAFDVFSHEGVKCQILKFAQVQI
jgi:hypothetical protein